MYKLLLLSSLFLLSLLSACTNFDEEFENIIENKKIRPFTVVLEPAEAAPGDTVSVTLHYYKPANKNYTIDWSLVPALSIDDYGNVIEVTPEERIQMLPGGTSDNFSFIVPKGVNNPIRKSPIVTDFLKEMSDNPDSLQQQLFLGLDILDSDPTISVPEFLNPVVDQLLAVMRLKARIVESPQVDEFELTVRKSLTVRYSKRLAVQPPVSSVNKNTPVNTMGLLIVDAPGIEKPADTINHTVTRQPFTGDSLTPIVISSQKSYFLYTDTTGAAQLYRGPDNRVYKEDLFYDWFFTNHGKEAGTKWEELIQLNNKETDNSFPIIGIQFPNDKSVTDFTFYCVAHDRRTEWGGLINSRGTGFKQVRVKFQYSN